MHLLGYWASFVTKAMHVTKNFWGLRLKLKDFFLIFKYYLNNIYLNFDIFN